MIRSTALRIANFVLWLTKKKTNKKTQLKMEEVVLGSGRLVRPNITLIARFIGLWNRNISDLHFLISFL